MKAKNWLISWFVIVIAALSFCGYRVYKVDPFFHYHRPEVDKYFYKLDNQRSQNDGISKHFEYDALITGTSMTENFRTSELDRLFGCHSIKVTYSGGSYKEMNDNLQVAFRSNPELKLVIRGLDMTRFLNTSDEMRTDLGTYPTYLYDNNPFNDVNYLLNRDVVFDRVYKMTLEKEKKGFKPGITTFDEYSKWQDKYTFGIKTVLPDGIVSDKTAEDVHLTEEEKETIRKNISQNVTDLADEQPEAEFYYFYTPYSIAWWNATYRKGEVYKQLEAEKYVTELILPHKNIHLYSFNNRTDIITDLNNYKDSKHYGIWINSLMLKWMQDGQYLLTEENYKDYLKEEYDFYTTYDYSSLDGQSDYEADYYAAALLNKELTGAEPLDVLNDDRMSVSLSSSEYISDGGKKSGVSCRGVLSKGKSEKTANYLRDKEYIGIKFTVDLDEGYNYLCFDGQKIKNHGCPAVYVYNERGEVVKKSETKSSKLDKKIHRHAIDLSDVSGRVTVIMNGGSNDMTGSPESEYQFTNIVMY